LVAYHDSVITTSRERKLKVETVIYAEKIITKQGTPSPVTENIFPVNHID